MIYPLGTKNIRPESHDSPLLVEIFGLDQSGGPTDHPVYRVITMVLLHIHGVELKPLLAYIKQ